MESMRRPYDVKPFNLCGLSGISDRTLDMHEKLYEGYVKAAKSHNASLNAGSALGSAVRILKRARESSSFAPLGLDFFSLCTHALRRGLHCYAAPRLQASVLLSCENRENEFSPIL